MKDKPSIEKQIESLSTQLTLTPDQERKANEFLVKKEINLENERSSFNGSQPR